jgi:hypothetical protein
MRRTTQADAAREKERHGNDTPARKKHSTANAYMGVWDTLGGDAADSQSHGSKARERSLPTTAAVGTPWPCAEALPSQPEKTRNKAPVERSQPGTSSLRTFAFLTRPRAGALPTFERPQESTQPCSTAMKVDFPTPEVPFEIGSIMYHPAFRF